MIHPQTVDYIAECAIIEISRIQRKAWECKEMARRLTADAKIILERAGYSDTYRAGNNQYLYVAENRKAKHHTLKITGGTVDNDEVVKLLNARGFDEFGYRR